MAATTRIINKFGKMNGWNNITVNLLGRDIEGISKIAYDDAQKKENIYGAGKFPIGRGESNYEAKASVDIYKEEVDILQKSMPPGQRLQDIAPFDIIVEYESKTGRIVRDRIRNCEFTSNGVEVSSGDGSISSSYELIVSHIEWNV